ncbi:MAG: hypothetical protein ACP5VP_03690 [Candidatus Limnocylindrales bacterium]
MRRFGGFLVAGLLAGSLAGPGAVLAASSPGSVAPPPNHHDDTAALQAALQACVPGGSSCTVRLRAGTYLTRQLFANGFHGAVTGAGAGATIVQALPGYTVARGPASGDPFARPPGASWRYPAIMAFGGSSDVSFSGLSFRVTSRAPVPAGWHDTRSNGTATWLAAAVYVHGSARFTGLSFVGAPGTDIPGGEGASGVNLASAVLLDSSLPSSAFALTRSIVSNTANGFELDRFAGGANVGGSPADGNRFINSAAGYYEDAAGATIEESYNQIAVGSAATNWQGILVVNHGPATPGHVVIQHNRIVENTYDVSGVEIAYAGPGSQAPIDVLVAANQFVVSPGLVGWADGILAQNTSGVLISGNSIALNGDVSGNGIDVQGGMGTTVVHNAISGVVGGSEPAGLGMGSTTGWGIAVYPAPFATAPAPATDTVIAGNTINGVSGVGGAGIRDWDSTGSVISGNTIGGVSGADGIDIGGTDGTTATGNVIAGAGPAAIALWGTLAGVATANGAVMANDVSGFTAGAIPNLTSAGRQVYLDGGVSHTTVDCATPGDTVLDGGSGDTLTGCAPSGAVTASVRPSAVGADISWPQCGSAYPSSPAFGIVGVTAGLAFSANPCLGTELGWAGGASAQLFANTGNPGPAHSSHWPTGQTSPMSCEAANPDSAACAYDYGYNAAADAYGDAAAAWAAQGLAGSPAASAWWLDVETSNSWRSDAALNVADLQGAVDYLVSVAKVVSVGFYSSPAQWAQVTGGTTAFAANPSWVGGASGLRNASFVCSGPAFTGGSVALAQYPSGGFDADLRCADAPQF